MADGQCLRGHGVRTKGWSAASSSRWIRPNPHNRRIVDLEHAPRDADGRVHFSSDLYVLRPVDPAKANGVLLFEVANRGNKGLLARFNRAAARSADPTTAADFGDGLLMKDGYTLVWIGWELDCPRPATRHRRARRRCCPPARRSIRSTSI